MKRSRDFFSTIGQRLTLISLAPVLVITLFLITFMVNERFADLKSALNQLGSSSASYIAAIAEVSMFAGDKEGLDKLAQSALNIPSVSGLAFIDTQQTALSSHGAAADIANPQLQQCLNQGSSLSAGHYYFCHRITSSPAEISDYEEEVTQPLASNWYGWVLLALSTEQIQAQRQSIFLISVATAAAGMVVSMLLALWIGHGISVPVRKLTRTVKQMESGDLSVSATIDGPKETQILAKGINQLADSVREAQTTLEYRVSQATHALTDTMKYLEEQNQQLEVTRDELQQAIQAKDHFLARMSHEMRTPLTTIIGYSQLLSNSELDSNQQEYSSNIVHASSLLLATIDDILDFSKLQSNALLLECIEFNVRDCLESLVALHAPNAYQKSLELVLLIDSDVPKTLQGDPTRLNQIVNNLLANAIKFTHQGEVLVRASVKLSDNYTTTLHFQVRDSGIGIDAQQLPHLFQAFSQADESITRLYGGSGLGLIICKQLVELMQGEVSLQSAINKGTEVNFCIPFTVADDESPATTVTAPEDFHILAYDNNPWSRRAIRTQLSRWSQKIYTPNTQKQFLQLLKDAEFPVELVVIGLNKTDLAVEQLTERLADLRIHYQGPILLLACTANLQLSIPQNVLDDYAPVHCLSKPAKQQALVDMLNQVAGTTSNSEPRQLPTTSRTVLHDCDILVVEDNHYNRKLICTILENYGASVREASNGEQAIASYQQHPCDLILMDVHMPVMDGIEATQRIVALADERGIPIIALTANVIASEHQSMLQAGAVEVLYKPLEEAPLIDSICTHLGRQAEPILENCSGILKADPQSLANLKRELNRLAEDLQALFESGDLASLREKIHEILGLAGLFGMDHLRTEVMELRETVSQQQLSLGEAKLQKIQQAIHLIQGA